MFAVRELTPSIAHAYQRFTFQGYRQMLTQSAETNPLPILMLGAECLGHPAGLLLCHLPLDGCPRILSLFVAEPFRRLGIGTALLEHLRAVLQEQNHKQLIIEYLALKHTSQLESLLRKTGWQEPKVISRYYRCPLAQVRQCKWLSRFTLPRKYRLLSWRQLETEPTVWEQWEGLEEEGYSRYFRPHNDTATLEQDCSLILMEGSKVIGWSLVDREVPSTMLYRALYIREPYRKRGLGPALLAQTAKRMLATDADYVTMQISAENLPMQKFVQRLIIPLEPVITPYKQAQLFL